MADEAPEKEGAAAPAAEEGAAKPGEEGGEKGQTFTVGQLNELIQEKIDAATGPLRERLLTTQAELIAAKAQMEGGDPDDVVVEESEEELLKRLQKAPIQTIKQIINDTLQPAIEASRNQVTQEQQLQATLARERDNVFAEFELADPVNKPLLDRATEIYQGLLRAGHIFPGMVHQAANTAYSEMVRAGKIKPGGPPSSGRQTTQAKPRPALRSVQLSPPTPSSEESRGTSIEDKMREDGFADDEIAAVQKVVKQSNGKVTLEKWWKHYSEERKKDPLFGLKAG